MDVQEVGESGPRTPLDDDDDDRAVPAAASRQPASPAAGTVISATTSSTASSISSSLVATCRYSEVAPAFSRAPSLRMLSASTPSASSMTMAARTIPARLRAG